MSRAIYMYIYFKLTIVYFLNLPIPFGIFCFILSSLHVFDALKSSSSSSLYSIYTFLYEINVVVFYSPFGPTFSSYFFWVCICEFQYIHLLFSLRTRNYSRNTGFEEKRRWSVGACVVYSLDVVVTGEPLSFHPAVFDDSVYALLRSSSSRDFTFNYRFSVRRTMMTFSVHVYYIMCMCDDDNDGWSFKFTQSCEELMVP